VEGVVKMQIEDTTNAVKRSGDGETDRDADPSRRVRCTCRVLMSDDARGTVLVIFFDVGRLESSMMMDKQDRTCVPVGMQQQSSKMHSTLK
jgi:hypothetical protein